jgi:adenosylcobinamide kinase/adenosylcobinamide-phosphate guanylyltransferase
MGHLTFLTGGARSGKSTFALELGRRAARPVTFIATAPPADSDPEMNARIERHRLERAGIERPDWTTIEEPLDVADALGRASGSFVVIDCLTLWVSNLMWAGRSDEEIERVARDTAAVAAALTNPVVVVTNEVGLGIHPDHPLGRRYRDVLGTVNQRWAAAADDALLMVAGRALRLDDPIQVLESVAR